MQDREVSGHNCHFHRPFEANKESHCHIGWGTKQNMASAEGRVNMLHHVLRDITRRPASLAPFPLRRGTSCTYSTYLTGLRVGGCGCSTSALNSKYQRKKERGRAREREREKDGTFHPDSFFSCPCGLAERHRRSRTSTRSSTR